LQPITGELLKFFNKNIGIYPYKQYSVVQGGDGGMEYFCCSRRRWWNGILYVNSG